MEIDLLKRHHFINHNKNKHSTFCRRSRHKIWFRGHFTEWSTHNKEHSNNFGMEILPEKFEMMAFVVQDPVRCKIIVDNKCWQQIKNFKHLGFEISYVNAKDIQRKLAILPQMLEILNNSFKPNFVQKFLE